MKGFRIALASLLASWQLASGQNPAPAPHAVEAPHPTPVEVSVAAEPNKAAPPAVQPLAAQPLAAQPLAAQPLAAQPQAAQPAAAESACSPCNECVPCRPRCWGSLEYLFWRIQDGPAPALVTTGDPNLPLGGPVPGALGSPGTQVLFGNDLDYGDFSGVRATFGGWCDPCQRYGAEVSAFMLQRRTTNFAAASDAAGNPLLAVPAFNLALNREDALILADPVASFAGSVAVSSSSRLWGAELNGIINCRRTCDCDVDLLLGVRYLNLEEDLAISGTSVDLIVDNTVTFSDRFDARNQFFGAQVGARARWSFGKLGVDLVGKIALGNTHQKVDRNGEATASGAAALVAGTFPGGFFTQPSNLGSESRDEFSVVPSAQIKLGYDLTQRLRATLAYDFLYWTGVARPGDQIDRSLNLQQSPVFMDPTLPAGGPARPAGGVNSSDFWAQGVSVGLEFRW